MRIVTLSCFLVLASAATQSFGQTTVTTGGGTSGTVPVFTGASTLGSSPLTVSGTHSGVGTSAPAGVFTIASPAADGSGSAAQGLLFVDTSQNVAAPWTHAAIYSVGSSGYNGSLVFATDGDNSNDFGVSERMRITYNGLIGIGTTTPVAGLDIANAAGDAVLHVAGAASVATPTQGAYFGWNNTGGVGETDFINNQGGGIGGWYFYNTPSSGTPQTKVLSISAGGSITFADGTVQSTAWSGTACITGGDYAESVDVSGQRNQYEAGDVLVIDAEHAGKFLRASEPYSTLIAGVFSTKPGFTGRRQPANKPSDGEIPMAMVGIVPTKVSAENGPIHVGDLLVTSSSPGHAMKGTDRSMLTGAVVGKALGSLDSGTGVIEVLISLQ